MFKLVKVLRVLRVPRASVQVPRCWATTGYSEDEKTHFGFQDVSEKEKAEKVFHVFQSVAEKYDLMNDAMSMGTHRLWKDYFVDKLGPTPDMDLIDMAGGTGDIASRVVKYVDNDSFLPEERTGKIVVADINPHMLAVGKRRFEESGLSHRMEWVEADAENLQFGDASFDAYTIAFGIRNCVHVQKVLDEAFRVLRRGGRFMCMEFSHVENPLLEWLYEKYSFEIIPVMGQIIAGDWESYQYLVESIRKFPNQEDFKRMIQQAGFRAVTYENLCSGVVAIHSGFKV